MLGQAHQEVEAALPVWIGVVFDVLFASVEDKVATGYFELGIRIASSILWRQVVSIQDVQTDVALFVFEDALFHVLPVYFVWVIFG